MTSKPDSNPPLKISGAAPDGAATARAARTQTAVAIGRTQDIGFIACSERWMRALARIRSSSAQGTNDGHHYGLRLIS